MGSPPPHVHPHMLTVPFSTELPIFKTNVHTKQADVHKGRRKARSAVPMNGLCIQARRNRTAMSGNLPVLAVPQFTIHPHNRNPQVPHKFSQHVETLILYLPNVEK